MLRNYRVIHNDGGTLKDLSAQLSDARSPALVVEYASGDYLYIGSELPFNHRYFDVQVANDQAATPTVELWTGNTWTPAVDLRDETSNGTIPLSASGILSWAQNEEASSWGRDSTHIMGNSGLETLKIYDLYWARLSWSATLKTTMSLNYIGHRFCREVDLTAYYPDLARATLKAAWAAGKTTWNEQIIVASEEIAAELVRRNVMQTPDQIIDWRVFEKACIHKTAEIIFKAFGQDYEDQLVSAIRDYKIAIDVRAHRVDKNRDIKATGVERKSTTEFMTR